jgi:hypothetical protein
MKALNFSRHISSEWATVADRVENATDAKTPHPTSTFRRAGGAENQTFSHGRRSKPI